LFHHSDYSRTLPNTLQDIDGWSPNQVVQTTATATTAPQTAIGTPTTTILKTTIRAATATAATPSPKTHHEQHHKSTASNNTSNNKSVVSGVAQHPVKSAYGGYRAAVNRKLLL
jgi:hypothetical protein